MIAPEVRTGGNRETGRLVLLRNNLLAVALVFFALELWRPCFFLTDDNLDGGYPFFSEMGRHLLGGRLPFRSDDLFNGHYDLLRDAGFFSWHPLYLVVSLLEATPFHVLIIDVDAFVLFLLTAAGFVNLAWHLRRELGLEVSDGWIMFYTLSFTFSLIALATGASWLNFTCSTSALPWLTLGILQRTWRRGVGLVTLFAVHQLLGGHLQPNLSNTIFLTLFAAGVGYVRRSWRPAIWWVAGNALALLIVLPLLVPMLEGFFSSARAHGVIASDMSANNIPFNLFPTSLFVGMALWIIHPPVHTYTTYTLAMGSCAAAWCLLPALSGPRNWTALEKLLGAMLLVIMVMVCRPFWVTELMLHLPVFRSMRWPFRELVQFQFFFHLFLIVRRPGFSASLRRLTAAWGTCLMVIPMLFYVMPPTLNTMETDRELMLTGGFDQFWSHVRPLFRPGDRLAVILPPRFYVDDRFDEPYSLMSTFNYSCLSEVVNVGGYSQTVPAGQFCTDPPPFYPFGAFVPIQKARLMAAYPRLKFITLDSLRPLKLTLSSRDGPTIDLTPYIPAPILEASRKNPDSP